MDWQTDLDGCIEINMGSDNADVYLDNVSLVRQARKSLQQNERQYVIARSGSDEAISTLSMGDCFASLAMTWWSSFCYLGSEARMGKPAERKDFGQGWAWGNVNEIG